MADLDDVCNVLVSMVSALVYPNGIGAPSITGNTIRVFQGWPIPQQLDADLAAGISQVSIYPGLQEKNTTRYLREWQTVTQNTPTLSMVVVGQTVTIAGTIPSPNNPHNVMIAVNHVPYVYAVQPTDTLASIATSLAALIGATSAGPVVTVPATAQITVARIGITGTSAMEVRRQERLFQLSIWCSTPAQRTTIAAAIDPAFAVTEFITMPDQFAARLLYKNSRMSDNEQKQGLYRRDLFYTVEYATTQIVTNSQVLQIQVNVSGSP